MSKADRAKKRKAAKAALPTLAPTPRRKSRGKERMNQIRKEGSADRVALAARCKQMGKGANHMNEMREQMLGEDAGRAIHIGTEGDARQSLWQTYCAFTASERTYAHRVLGCGLDPKGQKIEMQPERLEARPDDKPDLRSEDEKHRDATNAWMRWRGLIGHLRSIDQTAIFDVVRARKQAVEAGGLTSAGQKFVAAMVLLQDVVDGRG